MRRRVLGRLALVGAVLPFVWAVGAAVSPAQSDDENKQHPMLQSMEHTFKVSQKEDLKEYGIDDSASGTVVNASIGGTWVKVGEPKMMTTLELKAGVEYALIVGGDNNTIKLGAQLVDAKGKLRANVDDPVLSESSDEGNEASVVYKPKGAGRQGIRIVIDRAPEGVENCFVSYVLLRKPGGWDLPHENLKKAAENLEKRLHKLREAVPDAEFAFESTTLFGGVIPKGKQLSLNYGSALLAENDHAILIGGDGGVDPVVVTLGSFFRGPKPEESLDEAPVVTYRRGGAARDVVFANTKSEPSLVLGGIIVTGKK